MISVDNLLYGIDQKLNKLSTLTNQQISKEDKILALRKAQITLILKKLNPNNVLQLGFEANKKRYDDLQILIEPASEHKLDIEEKDKILNKWSSDLSLLNPKYMFYIDGYIVATKGECRKRVVYINHALTKHGDVTTLLNNSNYKPSFEYQETFNTLTDNHIDVYTDGTFTPTALYISYIRYPKEIGIEGYEELDGTPSVRQDCELPDYLEEELLNWTVLELGFNTENIPATQASGERVKIQE